MSENGVILRAGEDGSLYDTRGRMVMALKSRGWVMIRYPDMTTDEKRILTDIFCLFVKDGPVNDFAGKPLDRGSIEDYLNFRDDKKGDLCG